MGVRLMSQVLHDRRTKGADRMVLLVLADSANDSGAIAWPSIATIAELANVAERTAQLSVRALIEAGLVIVEANAGPHGVNRYRLTLDAPTPEESAPPKSLHPEESAGVQSDAPTPEESAPEPEENPITPLSPLRGDFPPRQDRSSFAAFWEAFPRRVGLRNAEKAWRRAIQRADPAVITAAAARYRADPNREPEFTAHPTTWLNRDGWHDDPLPARGGNARASPTAASAKAAEWDRLGRELDQQAIGEP